VRALLSGRAPSSWFPVHGSRQDGVGTPGQVLCSEMGSVLSSKDALPASSKFNLTEPLQAVFCSDGRLQCVGPIPFAIPAATFRKAR